MKYLMVTILIFSLHNNLSAQRVITLSSPHGGGAEKACEAISLQPGFSFTASSSNSLNLFINPENCWESEDNVLSHIPNVHSVATGHAVGEIPISSSVTPTGSQTYTIPIEVVPGINNLQPSLSLVYNSNGTNGIAGQGWSISGLSAIARTNSTIYHDDCVMPVILVPDPRYPNSGRRGPGVSSGIPENVQPVGAFALDGIRLIERGMLGNDVVYETEQGNMMFIAYVVSGQIKYFKVLYPNGYIGIFGYENNTSDQLCYPLTRLEDSYGNYIIYSYIVRNEHYYVDQIYYGASAKNATHFASVKFGYKSRSDVSNIYIAGKKITEDYLLENITCYSSGSAIRTYSFAYETKDVSLLKQVSYVEGGVSLNPLTFYYGTAEQQPQLEHLQIKLGQYYSQTGSSLGIVKGKFDFNVNNDALIVYPSNDPYKLKGNNFYNEYDPTQKILVYQGLNQGDDYIAGNFSLTTGEGFAAILAGDIDGVEGDEVIKINNKVVNGYDKLLLEVYKPYAVTGGLIIQGSPIGIDLSNELYNGGLLPKKFVLGDFNGDGKNELLVTRTSILSNHNHGGENWITRFYVIDLENGSIMYQVGSHSEYKYGEPLFVVDYDGDGKSDFVIITPNEARLYTFQCPNKSIESLNRRFTSTSQLHLSMFYDRYSPTFLPGDINGDGKTDFLISPERSYSYTQVDKYPCCDSPEPTWYDENVCVYCGNPYSFGISKEVDVDKGSNWTLLLSNGKDGFDKVIIPFIKYMYTYPEHVTSFILQDVNKDGLQDLIQKEESALKVYLNRNGKYNPTPDIVAESISQYMTIIPSDIKINDNLNADLLCLDMSQIHKISFGRDDGIQRMLSGVVNSLGVVSKTEYSRLSNDKEYVDYENSGLGVRYAFPYANFSGPLPVVSRVETFRDNVLLGSTKYAYRNAAVHRQGLGFLGFRQVTAEDKLAEQTATAVYDPLRYGVLVEESVPGVMKASYDYTVKRDKTLQVNLKSKVVTNELKGTTTRSTYLYDGFGSLTKEETSYGGGLSTTVDYILQSIKGSTINIIGLPKKITTLKKRNSKSWTTVETINYNEKFLPSYRSLEEQTALISSMHLEYDDFGNLKKEKSYRYSSTDVFETQYKYNANGRFLEEKIDPMGFRVVYAYDLVKSKVTSVISHKANNKKNETTFKYDALGRVERANYPDNTQSTTTYEWTIGQTTRGGGQPVYRIAEKTTNQPDIYRYYDGLNREVMSSTKGLNGVDVYAERKYDYLGRAIKVSEPYTSSSAILWSSTIYDKHSRPTTTSHPTGNTISYGYEGNSTVVSSGGITTTRKYNEWGEQTQVSDPGGTITYTYRPDGQLSSITAPDNSVTSLQYDKYSRQIEINDPSAGKVEYGYDSYGYQNSYTNAKGEVITTTYNKFGLPQVRIAPEFTTTYIYDEDYRLIRAYSPDTNTEQTFTFDDLDRKVKETDKIGSEELETSYTYTNSMLTSVSYSKMPGKPLGYKYDAYGNLTTVSLNGEILWKLVQENHLGQAEKTLLGNGVEQTYGYTPTGGPAWRKAGMLTAVPFQSFTYGFDGTKGLLMSRGDGVNGTNETFGYDALKRLTGHKDYRQNTVEYNSMGSPTAKTNVGELEYSIVGKPYAVGRVTGNEGSIPPRNQYVSYSSFNRPMSIEENGYRANFTYNITGDRKRMEVTHNGTPILNRYYLSSCYEKDLHAGGTQTERLYLSGSAYSAPAVWVKEGGQEKVVYIHRDHLGSITHLSDATGVKLAEYSYDAWGLLRDSKTLQPYAPDAQPKLMLGRGYTGHEHLPWFGLVNMNARLYDPVLGRFLAPDPYIQMPDFSQNFNRYSYGLNNPLVYIDPTGEKFWDWAKWVVGDLLTGGFISATASMTAVTAIGTVSTFSTTFATIASGLDITVAYFIGFVDEEKGRKRLENSFHISAGLFQFDKKRNFGHNVWTLFSRFTWESSQTFAGYGYSHFRNLVGKVDRVDYFGGATYVTNENSSKQEGISLGNYININLRGEITGDFEDWVISNELYMHEYGHYLDSRNWGLTYLLGVGIPSIHSASKSEQASGQESGVSTHDFYWTEMRANRKAKKYFEKRYGVTWNEVQNPTANR